MPKAKTITKDLIIDAAINILKKDGFKAINARSVAKELGCSTQPIYLCFKNMHELKNAITEKAISEHTKRVRESLKIHDKDDSKYSSYGMAFVKFAYEEKQLFRWLYLDSNQKGPYQSDIMINDIIKTINEEFGYDDETARLFHQDMLYFSYGLAILSNTNHLDLTEKELREAFRREFRALISIYGKPSKLPDFAVKKGIIL